MRYEHDEKECLKGFFDREYKHCLMVAFGLPRKARRHETESGNSRA